MLAFTRQVTMAQGRKNRHRGIHAREQVDNRDPHTLRATARPVITLTGHAHQAAQALETSSRSLAAQPRVRPDQSPSPSNKSASG